MGKSQLSTCIEIMDSLREQGFKDGDYVTEAQLKKLITRFAGSKSYTINEYMELITEKTNFIMHDGTGLKVMHSNVYKSGF